MCNIYILTEEGRRYSDEGLMEVINALNEKCNIELKPDDCIFFQGQIYNDPKTLIECLKEDANPIIILSQENGISMITKTDQIKDGVIRYLQKHVNENSERTSWQILMD